MTRSALAALVVVVAVLAALVVLGGAGVDDLELGQHEDDRAVLGEHRIVGRGDRILVDAHRQVGDEVDDAVAGARELVRAATASCRPRPPPGR